MHSSCSYFVPGGDGDDGDGGDGDGGDGDAPRKTWAAAEEHCESRRLARRDHLRWAECRGHGRDGEPRPRRRVDWPQRPSCVEGTYVWLDTSISSVLNSTTPTRTLRGRSLSPTRPRPSPTASRCRRRTAQWRTRVCNQEMAYLCYGVDPNAPDPYTEEDGKGRPPLPAPATDDDVMGVLLEDLNGDGLDDMIVLTREGVPVVRLPQPGQRRLLRRHAHAHRHRWDRASDRQGLQHGRGGGGRQRRRPRRHCRRQRRHLQHDLPRPARAQPRRLLQRRRPAVWLAEQSHDRRGGGRHRRRRRARHRGGQRRHAQRHLLGRALARRRHRPELRVAAGRQARRRHERQRPVAVVDDR